MEHEIVEYPKLVNDGEYSICSRCHITDRVKNNCNEGNRIYPTTLISHRLKCAVYQVLYEFNPADPPSGFYCKTFEEFYHKHLAPVLLDYVKLLKKDVKREE